MFLCYVKTCAHAQNFSLFLCLTELTQILNINVFVFKKSAVAKVRVYPMIGENAM
jgi:hypothetical protein